MHKRDLAELSRTVAHALRHEPGRYGLGLDEGGWTDSDALLESLRLQGGKWERLESSDIETMANAFDQKRFEIRGSKIRARYGHSFARPIHHNPADPPDALFHGTSPERAATILIDGLRPMARQFVHLASNPRKAREVGNRRGGSCTLLVVDAKAARASGIPFFHGGGPTWMAPYIEPQFISEDE